MTPEERAHIQANAARLAALLTIADTDHVKATALIDQLPLDDAREILTLLVLGLAEGKRTGAVVAGR